MLATAIARHYGCDLGSNDPTSPIHLTVPSISAVSILPQAPPDQVGRPLAANDSFPRLEPPVAGYRATGSREETEALFRRPRRAGPEARPRAGVSPREDPLASGEPRDRRINTTPLARPSSQFITQFIAQQVLPHDAREDTGFASDGALAYSTTRARGDERVGPVIAVEVRV